MFNLFRRPPEKPTHRAVRYVAATKSENREAAARRASVLCQLAVYCATTTPEQRAEDTERYFGREAGR